jgi:hypothetical protein
VPERALLPFRAFPSASIALGRFLEDIILRFLDLGIVLIDPWLAWLLVERVHGQGLVL